MQKAQNNTFTQSVVVVGSSVVVVVVGSSVVVVVVSSSVVV